jgi:chromatin segregation and condensation protein Rec8/ScpA/Scc1 (kleisin family)
MEKHVFTMMDDICNKNNKTDAQKQELLKKLLEYGEVRPFDDVLKEERAKYQEIIDNQTIQIEAIKDQELTTDEIAIVKAYRLAKSGVVAQHIAVEQECRATISKLEDTLNQFKSKIIAVVGE